MRKTATESVDRIPTEHEEQRNFVRWFRHSWPEVRIFAIPNGGARTPVTAARMKAEGVEAGVPDLFVPEWRLFVEMKRTKGGRVSQEQKNYIQYLENVGYRVIVSMGAQDAIKQILEAE